MKKKLISFIVMALIVSTNVTFFNPINVHAETAVSTNTTENKIKISLENIREIMIENSLDMKKYKNTLEISKEKYEDAKDTYNSTEKPNAPNKKDYTDDADYSAAKEAYNTEQNAYEKAKESYDTAKEAYKKAKITYDQNVEKAVYTAQQDYLCYLSTLANKQLQEDTVNIKGRDLKVDGLKYDYGFMSKNEYKTSTQNNAESNDKLKNLINEEALQKIKLYNELGVDEDDVIIEIDVTEDFKKITEINYEDDLETMLENNINLKQSKDSLDDLEDADDTTDEDNDHTDAVNDYNIDNAKIDVKNSKIKAEEDFRGQYNTLMNSYNSIKSSYDKILQEQEEYGIKQTKYDYGFLSKSELDNAKLTFDTDKATFIKNRNDCYLAYLKYIEMKEGY